MQCFVLSFTKTSDVMQLYLHHAYIVSNLAWSETVCSLLSDIAFSVCVQFGHKCQFESRGAALGPQTLNCSPNCFQLWLQSYVADSLWAGVGKLHGDSLPNLNSWYPSKTMSPMLCLKIWTYIFLIPTAQHTPGPNKINPAHCFCKWYFGIPQPFLLQVVKCLCGLAIQIIVSLHVVIKQIDLASHRKAIVRFQPGACMYAKRGLCHFVFSCIYSVGQAENWGL